MSIVKQQPEGVREFKDAVAARNFEAADFLRKLAAELAAGEVNLPSYPDFAVQVQKVLGDPGATASRIAQVVGADAALAARILRLANSSFMNPSGHQITDLSRALTQLGRQLVRCTAVSFAFKQMEQKVTPRTRRELHDLWQEGILVAAICHALARETGAASAEEALLAGLMHNIGRLYIVVNTDLESGAAADDSTWSELVQELNPGMARAILRLWGFPDAVAAAVGNQNHRAGSEAAADTGADAEVDALADILITSTALMPCFLRRRYLDDTITSLAAFQRLGLGTEKCRVLLVRSAQQIRSLQSALSG